MTKAHVFQPAKFGMAMVKLYDTKYNSHNIANVNSKKPLSNLPSPPAIDSQEKTNAYIESVLKYYQYRFPVHDSSEQVQEHINAKADMTKIVKFLLDQKGIQGIEVSDNNAEHFDIRHYSGPVRGLDQQIYKYRYGFKVGQFTKGENKIIQGNWARLMELNGIEDPDALLELLNDKRQLKSLSEKTLANTFLETLVEADPHISLSPFVL